MSSSSSSSSVKGPVQTEALPPPPSPKNGVNGVSPSSSSPRSTTKSATTTSSVPRKLPDDYDDLDALESTCASEEIRGAYRRLVRQHHPDKVPDAEKAQATQDFIRIQSKYKVVMERHARKRREREEREALERQCQDDDDATLEVSESKIQRPPKRSKRVELFAYDDYIDRERKRTVDIHVVVELSLGEVYKGCSKNIEFKRLATCSGCGSNGTIEYGPLGNFDDDASVHVCPKCQGQRFVNQDEKVRIRIPQSTFKGSRIVIQNLSHDCGRRWGCGDLVVSIAEKSHWMFRRRDNDLVASNRVCYKDMYHQVDVLLDTLDGTRVRVRKKADSTMQSPPAVFCVRIPNMGFLTTSNDGSQKRGAIYVLFCIEELFPHDDWRHDAWILFGEMFLDNPKRNAFLTPLFSVQTKTGEKLKFSIL